MKCPNCGTETSGNFCQACGAALRRVHCRKCGANLVPGARFCTQCGTSAGAEGAPRAPRTAAGGSNVPWYIAGGVLLIMLGILLLPMIRGDSTASVAPPSAPGTPPPLTGTPREQADRLFTRIMTARDQGDTTEAQRFTPMAIQAYQLAEPLDDDGLFHLASVHVVAGDFAAARRTAELILARSPDHLLGLAIAGEAAQLAGSAAEAQAYYRRFLTAYDAEMAKGLPEYEAHAQLMPQLKTAAEGGAGR